MIQKICIRGFGRIGKFVYKSSLNINAGNPVTISLSDIINNKNYVSLKTIYKNTQHKYHPETDYFVKLQNK